MDTLSEVYPGHCAVCLLEMREDDGGSHEQVEGRGMTLVCGPCCGRPPRVWPVGRPVPRRAGSDGDVRICARCRLALRPSEAYTQVRVREGDGAHANGTPAGALLCCPACVASLVPHVTERLVAEGVVTPERVAAGWVPSGEWLS